MIKSPSVEGDVYLTEEFIATFKNIGVFDSAWSICLPLAVWRIICSMWISQNLWSFYGQAKIQRACIFERTLTSCTHAQGGILSNNNSNKDSLKASWNGHMKIKQPIK